MIQEFVSIHWSDWMDIMTKGEKFKVRRIRSRLLPFKIFMLVCGIIHSAHHAEILVKWAIVPIEDATWENHWPFSKTYPDFILEDKTRILQAVGNDMYLLATPCLLAKPCMHIWNCDVSRITCKTCMEMLAVRWTEFTIN